MLLSRASGVLCVGVAVAVAVAVLAAPGVSGVDYTKYNKRTSAKWLSEVEAEDGVTKLPSGTLYRVLHEGAGKKPSRSDRVEVHYTGKLRDGTTFDSSRDRGQTSTFGVGQVIKGWTEALQEMPEGSRWELYIPASAAYGARGSPPKIGPEAALYFDVELIKIQ